MPSRKPTSLPEIPPEWDAAADAEYLRLLGEIDDEDRRRALMAELAPSAECVDLASSSDDGDSDSIGVWDTAPEPEPEPDAEDHAGGTEVEEPVAEPAALGAEPFACPGRGSLRVRKASVVEQCRECAWLSGGLGCVFEHQPAL